MSPGQCSLYVFSILVHDMKLDVEGAAAQIGDGETLGKLLVTWKANMLDRPIACTKQFEHLKAKRGFEVDFFKKCVPGLHVWPYIFPKHDLNILA